MSVTVGKLGIVRCDGDDLAALRLSCFERDGFRCTECGRRVSVFVPPWAKNRAHMCHIKGRGSGGSDTSDNVTTKCAEHHMVDEHNPKSVRAKEAR